MLLDLTTRVFFLFSGLEKILISLKSFLERPFGLFQLYRSPRCFRIKHINPIDWGTSAPWTFSFNEDRHPNLGKPLFVSWSRGSEVIPPVFVYQSKQSRCHHVWFRVKNIMFQRAEWHVESSAVIKADVKRQNSDLFTERWKHQYILFNGSHSESAPTAVTKDALSSRREAPRRRFMSASIRHPVSLFPINLVFCLK